MKLHIFVLFALQGVLICPSYANLANSNVGKVVTVSGKVFARVAPVEKQDTTPRRIKPGDPIYQNDVISTPSDGFLKILFSDESILDIGPSTLFKVDQYELKNGKDRQVELSMKYGKVRSLINQSVGNKGKFRFRTKGATMGVRGTEFIVKSDLRMEQQAGSLMDDNASPDVTATQITVVTGKVAVASKSIGGSSNTMELGAGSQLTTSDLPSDVGESAAGNSGQGNSQVTQLKNDELQSVKQDSKMQDQTFIGSVDAEKTSDKKNTSKSTEKTQVMEGVFANVAQETKKVDVKIENLKLPGTFGAELGLINQVNVISTGQPVKVRVSFTP